MKSVFSFLFIFCFAAICSAQTYFGDPNLLVRNIKGPVDVVSADIDGDGLNDLVSVEKTGSSVHWFKYQDGHFNQMFLIDDDADGAFRLNCGDVDNDGDVDIVVALQLENSIVWYENTDGNGTFSDQQLITDNVSWVWDICLVDIDKDNDLDIVSASVVDSKVALFENEEGVFTEIILSASVNSAKAVCVGDFDNDSDLDIFAGSFSGDIVYLFKNEEGVFAAPTVVANDADGVLDIVLADINNDTYPDLITVTNADDRTSWYQNNGDGTFAEERVEIGATDGPSTVVLTDLDADNDLDVIVNSINEDYIGWFENIDEADSFSGINYLTTNVNDPYGVISVDIDSDGDMDIVSASSMDNKIAMYCHNDTACAFEAQEIITYTVNGPKAIASADFNGDGYNDIAAPSALDSKLVIYYSDGQIDDTWNQTFVSDSAYHPSDVIAIDFDDDVDPDIVLSSQYDDKIAWYENTDSAGTFSNEIIITDSIDGPSEIKCVDLDLDGDLDIIAASFYEMSIYWVENLDDSDDFSDPIKINTDTLENVVDIEIGDLDGDGDMDIVACSDERGYVLWYENMDGSDDTFTEHVLANYLQFPKALSLTDIDLDGDLDVFVATKSKIAWFENDEADFSEVHIFTQDCFNTTDIVTADMDGDSDLDVLVAAEQSGKLFYFENIDGLGDFGDTVSLAAGLEGNIEIVASDLDSDMDLDLVAIAFENDKLITIENVSLTQYEALVYDDVCPDEQLSIFLNSSDVESYQWQVLEDGSFIDLEDDLTYVGVNTDMLTILECSVDMNENMYRCKMANLAGETFSDTAMVSSDDIIDPIVTCVSDTVINIGDNTTYQIEGDMFNPIEISDNCSVFSISNSINGGVSLSSHVINSGEYEVVWEVTDESGNMGTCSMSLIIEDESAIDEETATFLSLSPNPSTDYINFETDSRVNRIEICDIREKIVFSEDVNSQSGRLNIQTLPSGTYLVRAYFANDENVFIVKPIIVK